MEWGMRCLGPSLMTHNVRTLVGFSWNCTIGVGAARNLLVVARAAPPRCPWHHGSDHFLIPSLDHFDDGLSRQQRRRSRERGRHSSGRQGGLRSLG